MSHDTSYDVSKAFATNQCAFDIDHQTCDQRTLNIETGESKGIVMKPAAFATDVVDMKGNLKT